MNVLRVGLTTLILSCLFAESARADVRPLTPVQTLPRPANFTFWAQDVALDGGHLIVIGGYEGGQQALLYRRNGAGQFVLRRALQTWTGPRVRASVAMKNGIAAVQFGDQISIFQFNGNDYIRGTSAAPIRHHGGLAISGVSVLIGGNNCDYDAVIYRTGTTADWGIVGRIDDNQGQCFGEFEQYGLELHYDYAILRVPNGREGLAWRRNGTAVNWVPAGVLPYLPEEGAIFDAHYALQGSTAVAPTGAVWRRAGTSGWIRQGDLRSVERFDSSDITLNVLYRDGVLISTESGSYMPFARVYLEASPGRFEHVASMPFFDATGAELADVSGGTAVITARNYENSQQHVRIYKLPSPLRAPPPVVNDFEDRDISDLTFSGGQFSVATRGPNGDDVLLQNSTTGRAVALLEGTDWTDQQRVEADITPAFNGAGSWVAMVARYADADNYYYAAIRGNMTYGIYKRVGGVDTLLHESAFYNTQPQAFHARLWVDGNRISVDFSFQQGTTIIDNSLTHGRGGVATYLARADFDDLHVAATDEYFLFSREYGYAGADYFSGLEEWSGTWDVGQGGDEEVSYLTGLQQSDVTRSAVAMTGEPVANQELYAIMRVDSFGASTSGAWFGLLARYVDAGNHYYVTWRGTGQLQIRKIVNGQITVLASTNFAAVPGEYYLVEFKLINDQLQLYVDGSLVSSAHDRDITSGRYGLATYRATANWDTFIVKQP